jgi:hypothetical protein
VVRQARPQASGVYLSLGVRGLSLW